MRYEDISPGRGLNRALVVVVLTNCANSFEDFMLLDLTSYRVESHVIHQL